MKFKSLFVLSALSLLLLTACSQEQAEPIDVYFCSTSSTVDDDPWTLYIDDNLAGTLPNFNTLPNCGNTAAVTNMLHVSLSQERHRYEAKDGQGTVRSKGHIKYIKNEHVQKASVDGTKGGSSGDWSCEMVLMAVWD